MEQTMKVYKYINFVCLALGLIFWTTDTSTLMFELFIGTAGAMLFLVIGSYYPNRYVWTVFAYLAFFGGMFLFISVAMNEAGFFAVLVPSLLFLIILRPPATFLYGVLYSFWVLLITYTVIGFVKLDNSLIELVRSLDLIFTIFDNWYWLLFLGGYITSVLPFYLEQTRTTSPRFHFASGIIMYVWTLLLQLLTGIGMGIYKHSRNYIQTFRKAVRKQTLSKAELNAQPAFENYWFKKSFSDWKGVFQLTHQKNKLAKKQFDLMAKHMHYIYGFTLGAIPFTALKTAAFSSLIIGFILLVVTSFIHLVIIGIISIPVFIFFFIFFAYDSYHLRAKRIATVCPSCYHRSQLPDYLCYQCGREHTDLRPGKFGIRKRKCLCGTQLPTTALDERYELHATCKNEECKASLLTKEATPFCISVIGGPSSGKTSFIHAAVQELKEKVAAEHGWKMEFLHANEEEYFQKQSDTLKLGQYPNKTAEKKPFAHNFKLTSNKGKNPKLLYVYDPAGEVYNSGQELRHHRYLEYVNGYVLIIDPFSLPEVTATYEHENIATVRPSDTLPEDTYNMLMVHLAKRYQIKEDQKISTPLAIVINKVDAFHMEHEIATTYEPNEANDKQTEDDLVNEQCKAFLRSIGYSTFVKQIESKFKTFQFFTSSSSPTNELTKERSSRIITWLLEQ